MEKTQLVFIPAPAIGHLVSTVEFAKRLLDRDDRLSITILLMKSHFFPNKETYANSVAACQPRIQLIDLPQVDPPPLHDLAKSPEHFFTLFVESHKPHVTNFLLTQSRVAGLVLDFFCTSMIDVANELGLPSYIYLTSGATFLGLMLYLPTRHDQIGTEFVDSDPELVIPGFVDPVPPRVLPSAVFNTEGGYAAYIKIAKRFRDTKGIIVNTVMELESFALSSLSDDQTPPIYAIGPVIDLEGSAQTQLGSTRSETSNIIRWLDSQPPSSVVFLCFGSMGNFNAPQLMEIARGLEQSGQRFLWSIRQPRGTGEERGPPRDCKNPEEVLPSGFIERTRERGMFCGWVPQVEVLAHGSIGGFVSHCGWNSILESLWNGVPIVTWPMYAEQQLNAFMMVKQLGLAVEMRLDYRISVPGGGDGDDLVMADEIAQAVRGVMVGDSQVRQKVKEIGEKSRKALMDGGSSFNTVGRLIEDMLTKI